MTTLQLEAPCHATESDHGTESASDRRVFEFREVTEVGEVERLLALRHRVYAETEAFSGYVDRGGPPLMMDSYDRFARLFGLFARTPVDSRLIGTMRIVTLDPAPASMSLEMIAAAHPTLIRHLRTSRRMPLPLLELCRDPNVIAARVTRAMARGETVVEAGRFTLDPEFRAGQSAHIRLARQMIEATMAQLFLPNGCDHAYIVCVPAHVGMYERVGFRVVPGAEPIRVPSTGAALACLEVTRAGVVGDVRSRVLKRAAELASTGRAVLGTSTGDDRTRDNGRAEHAPPSLVRRPSPSGISHAGLHVSGA
jgi:N-acyl-L-homoserine lactone synthetase